MSNKDSKDGDLQTKQAILPLTGTTAPPLDKNNSRIFNLSTRPGQADASEYKMSIRALNGDEDLRCKLEWAQDAQTVMTGLNCQDVAPGPCSHRSYCADDYEQYLQRCWFPLCHHG